MKSYIIFPLATLFMHFWTVFYAIDQKSLLAVFITGLTPMVSWIYWAYYRFSITGEIFTLYNILLVILIIFWGNVYRTHWKMAMKEYRGD